MDTIRNWIAYASFLTMAAIAVTRSVGCLLFQNNLYNVSRTIFNSTTTSLGCLFIWGLAFATISLHAFSIKIGSYYFNDIVTYDVRNGTCHSVKSKTLDGTHSGSFLLNFAFFIPLFLILISYIFISIFLEVDKRRRELVLGNQTQVPVTQIQLTLLALSAAVILFCLPLLIFENIDFEDNNYKIKSWPASPAKSRDQNHSSPSRNQPSTQSFLGKIFSSMFNYKVRQSPRHNSLEISETFQIDHHHLPNT